MALANQEDHVDYMRMCVCSNLRKTTRVVTQLYDQLFQPTGLKITQYSMLFNIYQHEKISVTHLGEVMLLDQTTVTRNVNILKKEGYVTIVRDERDSRTKKISLTDKGLQKLNEVHPIWTNIQEKLIKEIGIEEYKSFLKVQQILQETISNE